MTHSATDPSPFDLGHDPIPVRQSRHARVFVRRILRLSCDSGGEKAHVGHEIVTQRELGRRIVSVARRSTY